MDVWFLSTRTKESRQDRNVSNVVVMSLAYITSPGYESSGAFSVDWVAPLDFATKKFVPVAYSVSCSAMKLDKKDGPLGKSGMGIPWNIVMVIDPFFEVIATPPGFNKPITLYRSEVVKEDLNPVWKRSFILNVS